MSEARDPREAFPGQPRCDWCGAMLTPLGECADKCRSWEERTRCAWCRKPRDSSDMIQVEDAGFGGECWEFCG